MSGKCNIFFRSRMFSAFRHIIMRNQSNPSRRTIMKVNGKNESIQCSIKNCMYHADAVDYCTLDCIKVGTHEMNPTKKECTDCESFMNKMQ